VARAGGLDGPSRYRGLLHAAAQILGSNKSNGWVSATSCRQSQALPIFLALNHSVSTALGDLR
jgi:hypothetical protein